MYIPGKMPGREKELLTMDASTFPISLTYHLVFALIAGWLILGEVMEPYEYAGCALMFAAIITAQLPQRRSRKDMPPDI